MRELLPDKNGYITSLFPTAFQQNFTGKINSLLIFRKLRTAHVEFTPIKSSFYIRTKMFVQIDIQFSFV